MKYVVSILIAILIGFGQVTAQQEILSLQRRGSITTGVGFQMWKLEDYVNPITQLTLPLTVVLPFGNRFNLTLFHTPTFSQWYEEAQIDGLSDTWIHGVYIFAGEKIMINAGVGAPTGKTRLNNEQFIFSRWLSLNAFRFRLPIYGQGLCGKVGLAFALPIREDIVIGVGGQYLIREPYHPLEYTYSVGNDERVADKEYQPGNEVSGSFGVDFQITENIKIMVDGIYTYYWPDLLSSIKIYESGQKISTNVGFFYRYDEKFLWAYIVYRHQGKNEILQGLAFEEEEANTNGPQVDIDLIWRFAARSRYGIYLLSEGRFYGRNEIDNREEASIFGGGFGSYYRLTDTITIDFRLNYFGGYITHLTGLEKVRVEGLGTYLSFKFDL